jgi:DMSO reductase anchor subunit
MARRFDAGPAPGQHRVMYWSGLFSGVTVAAIAVQVWMGAQLGAFRAMYSEFGGPLPMISQIVLHPGFQWGAPALCLVALVVANLRKPRPAAILGVIAALAVAAAVVEYWGAHLPIYELSGNIR